MSTVNEEIFNEIAPILVASVIERAVKDIKSNDISEYEKLKAKEWIKGNDCKMFCEALELDYYKLIKKLEIHGGC